jgi:LDH2 family malate/lactate/ureidoglycolate dehydrogenase
MGDEIHVKREDLTAFCTTVFEKLGVPAADARTTAEVLVVADLRNKGSHGVARMTRYVNGLKGGLMVTEDRTKVVHETKSTAVLDGGKSLGQVIGARGMKLAIEKAKDTGLGFVTARNSNHYGIAGYYSMMALEHGQIGISMTNAAPLVVPTFGADALLGTNPISIAIPADGDPFVLDMATSVVPRGKLEVYNRASKAMPEGWAVDTTGRATTDAAVVLDSFKKREPGGILPLGGEGELYSGHKGYGMGLAVELFCTVLSGAAVQLGSAGATPPIGHFFGAFDVEEAGHPGAAGPGPGKHEGRGPGAHLLPWGEGGRRLPRAPGTGDSLGAQGRDGPEGTRGRVRRRLDRLRPKPLHSSRPIT